MTPPGNPSAVIMPERPDSGDAVLLIAELEAELEPLYPPVSRHGLSVEQLLANAVAFFVLRDNDALAGCGGIQLFGSAYGELKRMYVRRQFRGLGYGRMLVNHLENHARSHAVKVVRLETGIHQAAAIRLYEDMGYRAIAPFGAYTADPLSLFYERRLT